MDNFCATLFEESKRFLEKSDELAKSGNNESGRVAYLHAALYLASCSLEGYVNSIASDFLTRKDLSIHERGFLSEKEVRLQDGAFVTTEVLKMARMDDRISFLCSKYGRENVPKTETWWTAYLKGADLRNGLTHPKDEIVIEQDDVARYLQAIVELLEFLFRKIYKKAFPLRKRALQSRLTF